MIRSIAWVNGVPYLMPAGDKVTLRGIRQVMQEHGKILDAGRWAVGLDDIVVTEIPVTREIDRNTLQRESEEPI